MNSESAGRTVVMTDDDIEDWQDGLDDDEGFTAPVEQGPRTARGTFLAELATLSAPVSLNAPAPAPLANLEHTIVVDQLAGLLAADEGGEAGLAGGPGAWAPASNAAVSKRKRGRDKKGKKPGAGGKRSKR